MRALYIFMIILASEFVFAQSSQYKKAEKKPVNEASSNENEQAKDQKIDLEKLEKQYWTPQDKEFKVVQNRKFSKEGRIAASLQIGSLINDPYSKGLSNSSATVSYFFSEFSGLELNYTKYSLSDSKLVERFKENNGTTPNFNRQDSFIGMNYVWVPIYGKISWFDSKIVYFDMAFAPGLGMSFYDQQTDNNTGETEGALTFTLDIQQHFFFHKNWAVRADFKTRIYEEDVLNASGSFFRTESNVTNIFLLGITYYH